MVNECIQRAIEDRGVKQKHIAEKIGVTEPTFCAMLSGNRKISVDEFFGICEALFMDPDSLYHYGEQKGAV